MNAWPISGTSAAGFSAVEEAFAQNFEEDAELGASFTVYQAGRRVVHLFGGFADRAKTIPWSEETITCIYSSGKAVISLLVAEAVSAGRLSYEAPIAEYWPEFGANGKETITLAQALSHQAGLVGFPDETPKEIWIDWEAVTDKIAGLAPIWTPGEGFGYHPQTVGFIAGEVLKRCGGGSIGERLKQRKLNIHCGMDEATTASVAYMKKPPRPGDLGEINRETEIAFLKPWSAAGGVSREKWAAAEIPGSNMHGSADALAAIVHPFANGGMGTNGERVLSDGAIDEALQVRVSGQDRVLPSEIAWAAGLMRNDHGKLGPSETAYGHPGFGGSCVIVDPVHRISAAYVMSKMAPTYLGDPRANHLFNAVYREL